MTPFIPRRQLRYTPKRPLSMSFKLQDHPVRNADVVNISVGGLGAWIPDSLFYLFEPNLRLKEVTFHCPEVYLTAPDVRLVFSTLKGQSARPGQIMFGGEFIQPDQEFIDKLTSYLTTFAIEK